MKNLNYIINGVLAVAVIVLFVLVLKTKSPDTSVQSNENTPVLTGEKLPIAYINTDSLLMNYNYAKDLNETLLRRQENARATITEKGRAFEKEALEFQRKVQNSAFLSQDRAQQEQQRLMKKEEELREMEQRLANEIMVEQQKMNEQLRTAINEFLSEYNKDLKYQVIFSNTMNDNILIAAPIYDITSEITSLLNERYSTKVKK